MRGDAALRARDWDAALRARDWDAALRARDWDAARRARDWEFQPFGCFWERDRPRLMKGRDRVGLVGLVRALQLSNRLRKKQAESPGFNERIRCRA